MDNIPSQTMEQNLHLFNFLESSGQFNILPGDPKLYFPDTEAAKWMLSLLLSSQDIGLTMKLLAPFFESKVAQDTNLGQYRFSHMFYFWRLFCAHAYEAWLIFNRKTEDDLVLKLRKMAAVQEIDKSIRTKLAFKLDNKKDSPSVNIILEKCRNVTFHYGELEGDLWADKLRSLKQQPLAISIGDSEADRRWIVADKYLDSRLTMVNLGDNESQPQLRDAVLGIVSLIHVVANLYFNEMDQKMLEQKVATLEPKPVPGGG